MEVRLCNKDEIPKLVNFLRTYWNPNHVLVRRREVLLWQYRNVTGGLNFLIAIDKNEIYAVLGIIPLSHFDNCLESKKEAWGALWKVRPDCKIPGLGTLLQRKATKELDFFGGIGVSQDNISIQKALKNVVVHINHYYVLNKNVENFRIAKMLKELMSHPKSNDINFKMIERDNINGIPEVHHAYFPVKSNCFLINRYQENPFYNYKFLCCYRNNIVEAIIVIKFVSVNNHRACRIIDVLGNLEFLTGLGKAIENYISDYKDIEYADFYNSGISKTYFLNNGFLEVDDYQDNLVIPNYFEPFLQKNSPLDGIIISKSPDKYVFFKGDADQDRPNI